MVTAVKETFKNDTKLCDALVASLQAGLTLTAATTDAKIPPAQVTALPAALQVRYKLMTLLDKYARSDKTLMTLALRQAVALDLTLTGTATKLYTIPAEGKPASTEAVLSWQTGLFTQEPAACVLGLVEREEIDVEDKLRPGVLSLLRALVQRDTSISQTRASTLLDSGAVTISEDVRPAVVTAFENIQRLANLVRLPQHIDALLKAGYTSANSIVRNPITDVQQKLSIRGPLDFDDSRRIYDFATTIEIRNEQAWALTLQQRNDQLKLPQPPAASTAQPAAKKPSTDTSINLTTLFKDMDTMETPDCTTVTSPSAYLVDLLRFLQEVRKDGNAKSPTLFSTLAQRRPDLQYLQLSCANTNTTIPYIDLVIEQLEYFVLNVNGKAAKIADDFTRYNSAPVTGSKKPQPQPRNVNTNVYKTYLLPKKAPMLQLPFNYAVDTARVIFSALGTSREAILSAFSSDEAMWNNMNPQSGQFTGPDRDRMMAQTHIANVRAISAETLNLTADDYISITGEGFESVAFIQAFVGNFKEMDYESYKYYHDSDYRETLTTAGLWGYVTEGSLTKGTQMLDDKNGTGLTFIKAQLLPRSGLTMAGLLEVLGTQFIARRLAIVADTPDGTFTDDFDLLRLKTTALVDSQPDKLDENICRDLQAFVRLQRKSGLSTTDLDCMICSSMRSNTIPANNPSITASVLDDLAAAKQLSSLTHLGLSELQPLWSTMDTNGSKSLYARLFLQPAITALDPIFAALLKGETPSLKSINAHRNTVIITLDVAEKDFGPLLEASELRAMDDLTLKSVSQLYRVQTLCTVFGIKVTEYARFVAALSLTTPTLCKSPQTTLQYLKSWQQMRAADFSVDDLTQVIASKASVPQSDAMLGFAVKLSIGMAAVERAYPLRKDDASGFEDVQKAVALLFETAAIPSIVSLIEGASHVCVDTLSY